MANLQLAVNGEYFDAMKRGEKQKSTAWLIRIGAAASLGAIMTA